MTNHRTYGEPVLEVDIVGTGSQTGWCATALALLLSAAQSLPVYAPAANLDPVNGQVRRIASSGQQTRSELTTESGVLRALAELFDDLAARQIELPAEAKAVLYSRLWDLYE